MTGKIYLLQDNSSLQTLTEQAYDSEKLLQSLLADYPDLLAGDQINEGAPRRWLLVSREVSMPGEMGSVGWVDHLFLDQDAIPTLVEVKRSSDTRLRREVVGQMLDYAANAVAYLAPEMLLARFREVCEKQGQDPTTLVATLLDKSPDDSEAIDTFWNQVKTNLQAGRIRMLFVADQIPVELRRIVEFLNEQMDPAEVLAVEIRQFVGQNLRTLVPRVVGQTAESERKKLPVAREARQWDEQSFFQDLHDRHGPDAERIARRLFEWAKKSVSRIWWGRGVQNGSFVPTLTHKGRDHQLFAVWTASATIEIYFYWFKYKPPFDSVEMREALRIRFNAIPGISLAPAEIGKRPNIPLAVLKEETALQQFVAVLDWLVEEIKAS